MVGEIYGGKNVENTNVGGIFSIIRIFPSQQFDDNNSVLRTAISSKFLNETNQQPTKTNGNNSDRQSASLKRINSTTTFLCRFVQSLQVIYSKSIFIISFYPEYLSSRINICNIYGSHNSIDISMHKSQYRLQYGQSLSQEFAIKCRMFENFHIYITIT
jgi:hypothetical protein